MSPVISNGKNLGGSQHPPFPVKESPPPEYAIDSPDLITAFSSLDLKFEQSIPTKDQCIAHLKLLEAFHQLREDIATTDGLFGINDSLIPTTAVDKLRHDVLLKIREKRWAVYVTKAVVRFEKWFDLCIEPQTPMLRQKDMDRTFPEIVKRGGKLSFTKDNLPPIGEFIYDQFIRERGGINIL